MLLVVRSCLIWLSFVTFGNRSEHGLNRELVGDGLLISAVDIINSLVGWLSPLIIWFDYQQNIVKWLASPYRIIVCICRAIVVLPEDGHLQAKEPQSSCAYIRLIVVMISSFGYFDDCDWEACTGLCICRAMDRMDTCRPRNHNRPVRITFDCRYDILFWLFWRLWLGSLLICRAIVVLPENGHLQAKEPQLSCAYNVWWSFWYPLLVILKIVTGKPVDL